jgi:hypothetical protein
MLVFGAVMRDAIRENLRYNGFDVALFAASGVVRIPQADIALMPSHFCLPCAIVGKG